MRYRLALSTCPNDTFMFHALMSGRIGLRDLEFDLTLCDIQELNQGMDEGRFDFCKASAFAALQQADRFEVCDSGAALGYGVGPLLLRRAGAPALGEGARVLCPGRSTTAAALFRHFFPEQNVMHHVVFSEIMPALRAHEADYGVVIHEGRFTYQSFGLELVADLGSLWEEQYSLPLPLGCIVARKDLPMDVRRTFESLVRKSIEYGCQHREEALLTMKRYAQELSEDALWAHVDLYVNQWSLSLGEEGQEAFRALGRVLTT